MIPEKELIYLAGFFDGEGSICVSGTSRARSKTGRKEWFLSCSASQKNIGILQVFKKYFGGCLPKYANKKSCHQWLVSRKKAEVFLKTMLPYLRGKRKVAELALQYRLLVTHSHGVKGRPRNYMLKATYLKMQNIAQRISRLNQED